MNRIDHERARELALDSRIGELTISDQRWLTAHVVECDECAAFIRSVDSAIGALRLPSVTADASLVRTTQAKVRFRAQALRSQAAAMRPLWIATALVCAWALVTTPLLWAGFAWLGGVLSLSKLEWRTGFFFAWSAPTLGVALLLLAGESVRERLQVRAAGASENV